VGVRILVDEGVLATKSDQKAFVGVPGPRDWVAENSCRWRLVVTDCPGAGWVDFMAGFGGGEPRGNEVRLLARASAAVRPLIRRGLQSIDWQTKRRAYEWIMEETSTLNEANGKRRCFANSGLASLSRPI